MFKYKYQVPKNELQTTFGSICIENIVFDPGEIEKVLPEIVLEDDNLKHMFAEDTLSNFKRRNIYRRFIPQTMVKGDMLSYVESSIHNSRTFYSFLAEGILGLVYRDVYGFDLAKGAIDVQETLSDSHTGVDACMFNLEKEIIVLGEAKFYEKLDVGMNAIINDFTKKSIKNKLESMQTAAINNEESYRIVIKNLGSEEYEEQTIEKFMRQKLVFAGFVLYSENDTKDYSNDDFYDKYNISTELLKNNICTSFKIGEYSSDYEILLVHLPVKSKKSLIVKMIEASKIKLRNM